MRTKALLRIAAADQELCATSCQVRFVGCEVLAPPAVTSAEPLSCAGYALELSEQRFRAYRLTLAPGEGTGSHRW